MKVTVTTIPTDSLTSHYLPADYTDVFACETEGIHLLSPDDILIAFLTDTPGWVNALFKLRNFLVGFVGLQGSNDLDLTEIENCIRTGSKCGFASVPAKNASETVLLMSDKHLSACLSVHIKNRSESHKAVISLITVVRFNNKLGNVYFFFIQPFHKIIVRSMLKRVILRLPKSDNRKTR